MMDLGSGDELRTVGKTRCQNQLKEKNQWPFDPFTKIDPARCISILLNEGCARQTCRTTKQVSQTEKKTKIEKNCKP